MLAPQPEVTKKIAFVYREQGKLAQAAGEYERIERESRDEELRREALVITSYSIHYTKLYECQQRPAYHLAAEEQPQVPALPRLEAHRQTQLRPQR